MNSDVTVARAQDPLSVKDAFTDKISLLGFSMSQDYDYPRIVAFIGTVGAGKSTQMKLLASELRKKGLKIRTTFLKSNHLFGRLLTLLLARILVKGKKDVYPIRALIENKPIIFKGLFKLWLILDLFSISIRFLSTISIPVKMGYTVLVEEYAPATISDYIYLGKAIGLPRETSFFAIRYISTLMHAGEMTHVIFLDARVDVLELRWKSRGTLNEKPDYIQMQRTTLLSLSKMFSSYEVLYIDTTNRNIRETHEMIVKHFAEKLTP